MFYHKDHIDDFIKKWPAPNRLLQAVGKDVKEKIYLAGARALGIIDKICTGPFYRLLSEVDNILELNPHLEKMHSCFEKWADLLFN